MATHSPTEIISLLQKKYDPDIESKILALYLTGSRLYQTHNERSDWDYIAITREQSNIIQ